MNTDISLASIIANLRAMERRMLALIVGGALLFVYFAVLGVQHWGEVQQYNSMLVQQQELARTINLANRTGTAPDAELEAVQAEWETMAGSFSHGHPDRMYIVLTDAASRGRVTVSSLSSSPAGTELRSGITYQVQDVSMSVQGSMNNIRRFLTQLPAVAPVALVSVDLRGLENIPTADLSLTFYINPEGGS
ncbi:MAG: hypothetical protein WD645_04885 [Dehalococcoidia bacterium]